MFDIFKQYGLVLEVVIHPKHDKWGKRCDYVRFKKVDDERLMEIKLDSIMVNGRKLYANVPKFQRTGMWTRNEERMYQLYKTNIHLERSKESGQNLGQNIRPNITFAQAVSGHKRGRRDNIIGRIIRNKPEDLNKDFLDTKPTFEHLQFNIDKEEIQRFEVHPWSPDDVDNERLTWIRCYELPFHAQCP
ncbi:unnamed protein product [Lathyrus sativus]|nr:unnamed protein product [Lathyrus sativus]